MSEAAPQSLQVHPDAADHLLAQQRTRLDTLVRDVALWRGALAEWQDRIARYRRAVEPGRRELRSAWRAWVFALDHASLQPGLSRAERDQVGELIREAVAPLLQSELDPEIAAVARRHANKPSSTRDAGDEELPQDVAQDWEQQAAAAAAQRAEWAAKRRAASAMTRRRTEEQEVSRSLRDVYRRLASALHPDREPDAQQRERKTALMQQANQAYAGQDLLALLELQLQAGQIDADRRRLHQYVTVLQEQLAQLQSETRRLEAAFREATGLPAGAGLQPRKADRMISSEAQRLRSELLMLRRQTRSLLDAEALKGWLREQRKARDD